VSRVKPKEFFENTTGENLNFTVRETHQSLRDLVRKFADAEIAPMARQLNRRRSDGHGRANPRWAMG
jgi:hypothetical protein